MVDIAFSCGNNGSLCFNSASTCVRLATGKESCVCPDGYLHDFVFGHDLNCVRPTWFLPAYFAVSTCGMGASMFINAREIPRLRSTSKRIAIVHLVALACEWLHILSVFIQDGNFAPGIVFAALFAPCIAYVGYLILMVLTSPVYAALKRPIKRWKNFIGCLCSIFGGSGALILFVSIGFLGPDQIETFNGLTAIMYIAVGSQFLIIVIVILIKVHSLESMIRSLIRINTDNLSLGSDRLHAFLRQLRSLKLALVPTLANVSLLALGIIYFEIGSVPYQFITWGLFFASLWPVTPLAVRFLRSRDKDRTQYVHSSVENQTPATEAIVPGAFRPTIEASKDVKKGTEML